MHRYIRWTAYVVLGLLTLMDARAEESSGQTRADYIKQKVSEADRFCDTIPLSITTETDIGRTQKGVVNARRITERPVIFCAYSEEKRTWHAITVHLENPTPKEYVLCIRAAPTLEERRNCPLPMHVVTPGYRIEHLKGYGITRLIVNAYLEETVTRLDGSTERVRGEHLVVYRTRHAWFDDDALASNDVDRIIATAKAINYTPYHPDLRDPALVEEGMRFLYDKIKFARLGLGYDISLPETVRSRAYPDRSLASVVPWEIPMSLAVIEQIDDKTFQADNKDAVEAVLTEYALDREEAFRWSQSGANAIGPLQFTNAGGDGTYSAIVRNYPRARIDPDFQIGARTLGNVIPAAIALIDQEVSQFPEIKTLFARNPRLGGIYPVAAYNGGPAPARALYAWIKKRGIDIEHKEIEVPTAITTTRVEKCPCVNVPTAKGKKKKRVEHIVVRVANTETPGYIVKYIYLLNYLADKGLE